MSERAAMQERYAGYYREVAASFDAIRLDRDEEIETTCRIAAEGLTPGATMLDIGCGTGRYGAHLQRMGFAVTGVDCNAAQLEHAHGLDAVVHASATALPFPDMSFDACLMVLMVHQLDVDERSAAFAECARVLRPGSRLLIKTSSHADLALRALNDVFPSALAINVVRYPDVPLLARELADAGLRVVRTQMTRSRLAISPAELLTSIDNHSNTTLALLPPAELAAGREALARRIADQTTVEILHPHTHVIAHA